MKHKARQVKNTKMGVKTLRQYICGGKTNLVVRIIGYYHQPYSRPGIRFKSYAYHTCHTINKPVYFLYITQFRMMLGH